MYTFRIPETECGFCGNQLVNEWSSGTDVVCCSYTQTLQKPRMKLLALVIPYSGDPKVGLRYDTIFSLGPFNINKSQFRCLYVVTPFGVAGRGNASREIACIGHSVLWGP